VKEGISSVSTAHQEGIFMHKKVISTPGAEYTQNPYFTAFSQAFSDRGVEVLRFRSWNTLIFDFDVFVSHFPHHAITEPPLVPAIIKSATMIIFALMAKAQGKKIVWVVHDLEPLRPRRKRLTQIYLSLFARCVSSYVFLTKASRDLFNTKHTSEMEKPSYILPHPPYPCTIQQDEVAALRRSLDPEGCSVLVGYLGDIKTYKDPSVLSKMFPKLRNGRPLKLVVCGLVDADCVSTLSDVLMYGNTPVHRRNERLDDHQLMAHIKAVDFVLLPYKHGWNSGMLLNVLSCGGRALTTPIEAFVALQENVGEPWVYVVGKEDGWTESLEIALKDEIKSSDVERLQSFLRSREFSQTFDGFCRFLFASARWSSSA
jgi:hypothetical protein